MSILPAIADYDGRHNEPLEAILRTHEATPELLQELVTLSVSTEANIATGAMWLFRTWVERGATPRTETISALADRLVDIEVHWARQLVCQSIGSLEIGEEPAVQFAAFLEACCSSERPFLRAWGTDGLHRLSQRHSAYEGAARAALEAAFTDTAASVRARARRIVAEN